MADSPPETPEAPEAPASPESSMASDPTRLWRFAGLGLEFAVSLLALGFLGWLFDSQMGSTPWGTLTGAMLGLAGGLYLFVKHAREAVRSVRPSPDRNHHP